MAGTKGYGATDITSMAPPTQEIMKAMGKDLCIQKEFQFIEMCGLEGPNHYVWHHGNDNTGPVIAYTREESSCLIRTLCTSARGAEFITHLKDRKGPVALKMKKDQNICLCRCAPHSAKVTDVNGKLIGTVELPWWSQMKCMYSGKAIDSNDKARFEISACCCQAHTFLPCCFDFDFEIKDLQNDQTIGSMQRHKLSWSNCCGLSADYGLHMSPSASGEDRTLLASTLQMIDICYFDMSHRSEGGSGG